MNKKQLKIIFGAILICIALYYGYYHFQFLHILHKDTVVIQSQSTDCTNNPTENGCSCSSNSDCSSGDCFEGECALCRKISQTCYYSGQCCGDIECDTQVGTCGVAALTTGSAVVVGGLSRAKNANWVQTDSGQWININDPKYTLVPIEQTPEGTYATDLEDDSAALANVGETINLVNETKDLTTDFIY